MKRLDFDPWPQACLQVYTGNGKGKTTAAFGLALRAAGRGVKVFIGQFMKGSEYGELFGAGMLGGLVDVEQFGSPSCIPLRDDPAERDVALAKSGLERCRQVLIAGEHKIVVLDEINVAIHFKLLEEADVLTLIDSRHSDVELICTGRWAPESLLERADLVTEMREVKHPFNTSGLAARDGIER